MNKDILLSGYWLNDTYKGNININEFNEKEIEYNDKNYKNISSPINTPNKKSIKIICNNFNSSSGCTYGNNCHFLHK
jgi:hypothetical protein